AGLGAYVLARRLGLAAPGASLAAAGFAGSGALLAGLGSTAGHVVPFLPWLVVAIDRLREARSLRGIALVGVRALLVVLGGQPETAFFCGVAAFSWAALTLEGRARTFAMVGMALGVLACAPVLVPFVEYLRRSGALVALESQARAQRGVDVPALGMV